MSKSYLIRFKKIGPYRFISGLDTINMIERTFRRTNLDLVFTSGFHPKPKFSYIDPVSTGIIDLAFYVIVNLQKDYKIQEIYEELINVQPSYLRVDKISNKEVNLSKINKYEFSVIIRKPFVFDDNLIITKKTKRGEKQISLSELKKIKVFEKKDYIVLNYIIDKEKVFNPYLISEKVFLGLRKEAYIDNLSLSSFFERGV